ncbi:MAG: hypothetical protein WBV40_10645 [Candidatus Cybelea sp.]|jgi:hypothetical protein
MFSGPTDRGTAAGDGGKAADAETIGPLGSAHALKTTHAITNIMTFFNITTLQHGTPENQTPIAAKRDRCKGYGTARAEGYLQTAVRPPWRRAGMPEPGA